MRDAASQIIRDQYNRPDFAGFGVNSKGDGGGTKGKGYVRRSKAPAPMPRRAHGIYDACRSMRGALQQAPARR